MLSVVHRVIIRSGIRPILGYLVAVVMGSFAWETCQLPLYTLWWSGTRNEIIWAVIHCTGGDALIAVATLAVALMVTRLPVGLSSACGWWPSPSSSASPIRSSASG
jgi:hypothetical protein